MVVVLVALFALDRVALPLLEQRGLTAGDDWQRHNAIVTAEHRKKDTSEPLDESVPVPIRFGVRSWTGHPVSKQKTAACRILVMGDSFVWGSPYLTLNHMWWRQLENELLSRGYDVEVIAAGQPGAATRDQLTVARRIIPEYRPDLIIWGYVTNDPDEGLIPQISWSQQSLPGFNRIKGWAARVWPRLVAKFDALRSHKLAKAYTGPKYGYEYDEWERKLVEPSNLAVYEKTVRGVKALMDEHQLPGFMLTLPNYPSTKHFAPRLDPILPVWRDAGIATHNTLPAFVAKYGEAESSGTKTIHWGINPADGHPGPRACRFLGWQAAKLIEDDFRGLLGVRFIRESINTNIFPPHRINDWLPHDLNVTPVRENHFTLTYPTDTARLPFMPDSLPATVFALREPSPLSQIEINGRDLQRARFWVSCLDSEEGYDDGVWHMIEEAKREPGGMWPIPRALQTRRVSLIRLQADIKGKDSELTLTLIPAGGAEGGK